jgi:hypothetical protein
LLDIQDDLARVVVWLAEHWSADLPAPTVYGYGGGPSAARVELSVYYLSPDDLARVAELLGASPVDDPAPDGVVLYMVRRHTPPECEATRRGGAFAPCAAALNPPHMDMP